MKTIPCGQRFAVVAKEWKEIKGTETAQKYEHEAKEYVKVAELPADNEAGSSIVANNLYKKVIDLV
jgi:hypothetical protein